MSGGESHSAVSNSKCLLRVNRVTSALRRSLPVYPDERTSKGPIGVSQRCEEPDLLR
jgi:hypothetical protein